MKYLLIALLFSGCCSPETIIREVRDTIRVPIPQRKDALTILDNAPIKDTSKIAESPTVAILLVSDPKDSLAVIAWRNEAKRLGKLLSERKPDTVTVYREYKDTVQVYNKIGDSFKDDLYDYAVGFVICVVLLAVVFIVKR